MILFYNWQKIFTAGKANSYECFLIFKMLVNREVPKSKHDPIYYYSAMNFSGSSFLLEPERLLWNAYKYSYKEICIYLAIASLRLYADCLTNGTITLELIKYPLNVGNYLNTNRLLNVEDNLIHFLYEKSHKEI